MKLQNSKKTPSNKEYIWFAKAIEAIIENQMSIPLSEEKVKFLHWCIFNHGYNGRLFKTAKDGSSLSGYGEKRIQEMLPILRDENLIEKRISRGVLYYCIIIKKGKM